MKTWSTNDVDRHPSRWYVVLGCGCPRNDYSITKPVVGTDKVCLKHGETFIQEIDTEYNVKCLNCSSSKWCGMAKLSAQLFADQHHRKQPTHRIQVRKGLAVVEIRTNKNTLQKLEFEVDEPPF